MSTQLPARRRVLLIEDEPDIVRGLTDALTFEGYDVFAAGEGRAGVRLAHDRGPDCIILDLMLPDINGYAVCEQLRAWNALVPIIILTARGQESDKVRGLEAGADDYVTKPFSLAELLARIRAIFRRFDHFGSAADASGSEESIRIGEAEVNFRKHTVTRRRKTESLSFYEVELLKMLSERAEQPISRDEILDKIWGVKAFPSNRTVDNFVVKLRRKIESDQKPPRHILTVYGMGYKLVP
jgi:DNA-binding response OmpR family regulator